MGKLYYCIYSINKLLDNLGGKEGVKCFIADFRRRVHEAGLGDLISVSFFTQFLA
jgi:hypothetical protein